MVFSSTIFLMVFLPAVYILNFICKKEYSNILLLIASLIFYAWGEPYLVGLMVFSIVINWLFGMAIARSDGARRRLILALGIIINLCILCHYKYVAFFASIINHIIHRQLVNVPQIALPIGISFFTFQAISYIIDVYRKDTDYSTKLVNVALYISFFPQLIAGPIVKYKDINKQIEDRKITWQNTALGFKRFIYGLGKKVLISNILGSCVDKIYGYDFSLIDTRVAWIAALAYTFQIYYDFSGYSDMAIGLGRMFGFNILENFNYPYLSRSISEFWRRWHISLGTWFREYVYIPLGGNKKGKLRTYINLGIVFILTGLWHGAAFAYILWGMYHGFFVIIERLGFKKILDKSKVLSTLYCFLIVNFGWVPFRTGSAYQGLRILSRMLRPWRYANAQIPRWKYMDNKTIFIFACAVLGMGILTKIVPKKIADRWNGSVVEAFYCIAILLLCLASIASGAYNPFIYFQF